jgi:hypothetical protein
MAWKLAEIQNRPETAEGLTLLQKAYATPDIPGRLSHSEGTDNARFLFRFARHEIHQLLCTKSARYRKDRKLLLASVTAILGHLSGLLTANFGVAAALAQAIAAVAVYIPCRIGLSAWCKKFELSPDGLSPEEEKVIADQK